MKPQLKLVSAIPTTSTQPSVIKIQKGLKIQKRDNSKNWLIYITVKGQQPQRKSAGTADVELAKKVALQKYSEVQYKLENNLPVRKRYFAEVADKFLLDNDRLVALKDRKPATAKFYKRTISNYFVPYFGKMSVEAINRVAITQFQKWRIDNSVKFEDGVKAKPMTATLNKEETALNRVLEFALENGFISIKPTIKKTKVKSNRHPAFTKKDFRKLIRQLRVFIEASPNASIRKQRVQMYSAIIILTGSGMRKHELMPDSEKPHKGLRWCDVDLDAWKKDKSNKMYCKVTITKKNCKNSKGREIYFGGTAYWHLKRMKEKVNERWAEIAKVFDSDFRRSFNSFLVWANMRTNEDGENYCMYSFRHSFATWKIEAGIPIKQLADVMGNSVAIIEKHYSHALTANFKENFI